MSGWERLRARWRRRRLSLWYHVEYAPACLSRTGRVSVLPLDRVERVVSQLAARGLLRPGDLHPPAAVTLDALARVHTRRYLESVARAETLARIFALEPSELEVDCLLRAQRRAVGGTVMAARRAALSGEVGFNLGGGFHHAEPDGGWGFCVYNDVAVAVALLRQQGFSDPIAIVDLDYHPSNGNMAAFAGDRGVLVYSIDGVAWASPCADNVQPIVLPAGTGDREYLARLRETLPFALQRHRPRIVFYVAGNDVLAGDPLGGFRLTLSGLIERDRFVVAQTRRVGAALVVTLGGGYTPDAWRGTAAFLGWLLTGSVPRGWPEPRDVRARFEPFAASVGGGAAWAGDSGPLTEEELFRDLWGPRPAVPVLHYDSTHALEDAFEQHGILERLRGRGFSDLALRVDAAHPERQVIRLFGSKGAVSGALLLELVFRRETLVARATGETFQVLWVDWLLLQDPTAAFSSDRPPLPGQEHPGLGVAEAVEDLLVETCRRLGLDGVASRPAHYHHAAVAARRFHFLDPTVEGRFLAMRSVLASRALAEASRLVHGGALRSDEGVFEWQPADYVLPVSERLGAYLRSVEYTLARDAAGRRLLEGELHVAALAAVAG